jgi:NDP-sugar pyrophosphorylase family protein
MKTTTATTPESDSDARQAVGVKALILAAGEGSRLRPLTLTRPKPMLPIGGRPLLEHTVRWLRSYGIVDLAINLHYRGDAVTSHFTDGSNFGVNITYSHEETLAGTAGAVRKLNSYFHTTALIVYGDLLTNINLRRLLSFHFEKSLASKGPVITLSLYEPPNPRDCGIVELNSEGRVLRMQEKPKEDALFSTLSFAGVMVIDRAVIELIPPDTFYDFGYHVLPDAIRRGLPMYGLPIVEPERVIDIGTPERYALASDEWNVDTSQSQLKGDLC